MAILPLYGQEYSSDAVILNDDSTSMLLYVGDYVEQECWSQCVNLSGSWRVATWHDVMVNYDALSLPESSEDNSDFWDYMWVHQNSSEENPFGLTLKCRNEQYEYNGGEQRSIGSFTVTANPSWAVGYSHPCYCATIERPKVEYYLYSSSTGNGSLDSIQGALDELASEGWKVLTPYEGNKLVLWRYAE